ncbi:hypothetical protein DPMN_165733 [Dreissena polymorpha]|uniref:Uncharacterized protein n=1 Tax=Dreissena polymorpha TaxID=45954 RepID=A0A9D4F187_DREPO|nr:hypothetical protein DPMN_165733 [Dreissena polymorpha]
MEENKHYTDIRSQREQFNKAVTTLTNIFDTNFIDPFDVTKGPDKLVNFSTGTQASGEVIKSMINSLSRYEDMMASLVRERLVGKIDRSDPAEKKFILPKEKGATSRQGRIKTKQEGLKGPKSLT